MLEKRKCKVLSEAGAIRLGNPNLAGLEVRNIEPVLLGSVRADVMVNWVGMWFIPYAVTIYKSELEDAEIA